MGKFLLARQVDMLKPIRLRIPKSLLRKFRQEAIKAYRDYNREHFCFLIGTDFERSDYRMVEVHELYFPENVLEHTTIEYIDVQNEWYLDAENYAKEAGWTTVGDCHSHPDRKEAHQSELDLDYGRSWNKLSGICAIWRTKNKFMSRYRWWGPQQRVDVV